MLKAYGIKIICVGIGSTNAIGLTELQQVATSPEEVVRLQVDRFDQLESKKDTLIVATCFPPNPKGESANETPLHFC